MINLILLISLWGACWGQILLICNLKKWGVVGIRGVDLDGKRKSSSLYINYEDSSILARKKGIFLILIILMVLLSSITSSRSFSFENNNLFLDTQLTDSWNIFIPMLSEKNIEVNV